VEFWSFFHVDKNAIFRIFWRRRRRKSGFGGDFEANSLSKITGKSPGIFENWGVFLKILGNSWEFSEIPGNSRKFPEILGNFYCFLKANLWKTSIFIDSL